MKIKNTPGRPLCPKKLQEARLCVFQQCRVGREHGLPFPFPPLCMCTFLCFQSFPSLCLGTLYTYKSHIIPSVHCIPDCCIFLKSLSFTVLVNSLYSCTRSPVILPFLSKLLYMLYFLLLPHIYNNLTIIFLCALDLTAVFAEFVFFCGRC